jgi:sucrose-6-phosphate hydrolase SacC (GH32 family)
MISRTTIDTDHFEDGFSRTTILFKPNETQIVIDRHAANRKKGIDAHVETSPLTLLLQHDRRTAKIKRESLNVRVFYDKNALEVFVNDRVAMSTYVQPDSKKCFGINSWVGDEGSAKMVKCQLWELKLSGREQKL